MSYQSVIQTDCHFEHTHTSTDGGVLTAHQSTNTFETAFAEESPLHVLGQEQTSLLLHLLLYMQICCFVISLNKKN